MKRVRRRRPEARDRGFGRWQRFSHKPQTHVPGYMESKRLLVQLGLCREGEGTHRALRTFQRSHGLAVTGRPDAATLAELVASIGRAAQ